MNSALETHAHVSTRVENTVNIRLVADDTLAGLVSDVVVDAGAGFGFLFTGFDSKDLDLLSNSKNINESSGLEVDI